MLEQTVQRLVFAISLSLFRKTGGRLSCSNPQQSQVGGGLGLLLLQLGDLTPIGKIGYFGQPP